MSNAVYLALTYDEVRTAGEWLKQANEKFPKSLDLMALSAWHLRITGKIAEAQNLLTTIREKNPNHLLALIESGINAYNAGEKTTAKEYMKKAKIINAG